ncbi:CusA/CzcA family heavy metal efflux RND transporter [Acidiluteibacter ferrifornacis]|uniref:CusA/CzcA family heavy metal efflux RND transporter n=1 Tax=Acidiluteibacter ferrifornacis TaxID=2692424 RepID=A0A6N9NFK9_9FLAO|nr:CusA/CzcA family heavy metal efflux RND transporter [Acidiluteibacter ferrifornacis]NBG64564.1 CusA/CzcA family heavy metal efflux RND transporter [Acidiluteibacter ferrifornacis]
MLSRIIQFSLANKLIIFLFTTAIAVVGLFSISQIPFGVVPDITNNQVQVITTSTSLSTQDIEQFITYPVELEMSNLPGVKEIRSVSKFGLSVVTVVFEDDMGTYLPRQLLAEKINAAAEKIPQEFGRPEMGPITTGLGEIYQYIIDVKPGFEDRYTLMELRTIQDWIVRRQLSGIPGVVEVNSWGGLLKQYEVAIKSEQLAAKKITITQVMDALENNNSVAGGGYIEKANQSYFIRGDGLVSNLEDIENIVVENRNGTPIFIRDIAKVGFGSANRFGATTANGQGEKVLGQVMMLKDANSNKVINAVQKRVEEIQSTLPEGVFINGFLDRSTLIDKTTFTIGENLILGCLIVIFVVVLLLGNIRSGLVVASVIPLSLLFAISLMNIFGVDANLMSLGAIDFGIIIDGAVIIVEFIAFQMTKSVNKLNGLSKEELQTEKDAITLMSANKMMSSAVFGQIIILIVFIPIFSLAGVEGKMFQPMALTFSFALIGTMVLCFTYVPAISSILIKPDVVDKPNFSKRLNNWLANQYEHFLTRALSHKKAILTVASALLIGSVILFNSMGGEFVPTLDEGDFVIQPVLKTGTSLSSTIATTTKIEQILIDKFPEVDQIVTRIGAAEVPTDPMSMEESDVMITLKPKSEWTSAKSKDELADLFKEALTIIPGLEVEFTQPIEMRFNELITGVRADIAIKIVGEDLEFLSQKANEIKTLISNVEGAADITVEKITGLPQMSIDYKRDKIARYGLSIAAINQVVSMAFGGQSLGSVFEGEKRFDLVLRLDQSKRTDIDDVQNLYVDLPNGGKIPLSEVAEISYKKGAAKISRDDTKRRTVVGINVRNRDLQSVVDDVQKLITENVKLPVGYTITYGGQFENLTSAKNRLLIAVPIALILIFIFLFFAFKSVKDALIIYSAIPLSAVGGILLLWIRDMPFSISAGVGFIALFGIAVLNGIVMIEHFKELQKEGELSNKDIIILGSKDRLRAVLLTASAAALGFLPMAISTNAGAEVQRPLATVVVGGLISATLLTLIVLPILYSIFKAKSTKTMKNGTLTLLVALLIGASSATAQENTYNIAQLEQLMLEHNSQLKAGSYRMEEKNAQINGAFQFEKTEIYYGYDQNNLAVNNLPLDVIGVQQNFAFPTIYAAERKANKANLQLEKSAYAIQQNQLKKELWSSYYQYQFEINQLQVIENLDSLYQNFSQLANRRFELGETTYLEKATAQSKQRQVNTLFEQAKEDVKSAKTQLINIVQAPDSFRIKKEQLTALQPQISSIEDNVTNQYFEDKSAVLYQQNTLVKQQLLPDITVNYFQGKNSGLNESLYGYQLGLKIPLLFTGQQAKIKASQLAFQATEQEAIDYQFQLKSKYNQLIHQLAKYQEAIDYYQSEGNALATEITKAAEISYKTGEIDFFQYIQSIENAYQIKLTFLENLNNYNQTAIAISYLTL